MKKYYKLMSVRELSLELSHEVKISKRGVQKMIDTNRLPDKYIAQKIDDFYWVIIQVKK